MLLNNEWVRNEIREEIRNFLEKMKTNSQQPKIQPCGESPERQVHSNTGVTKKDRNISNK